MAAARKKDIVDVLNDQHNQIRQLFGRVKNATGAQKRHLFDQLVRLLAVHESAEEEILHPAVRAIKAAEPVVEARLQEEHSAKEALAELCDLGVEHPDFDKKLAALEKAVDSHARHEENDEFPYAREHLSQDRRQRMADALKAAERTAPTRPHPAAGESAAAQLLVGTPVGLFDRARDAFRDWRQSSR